MVRILSAISTKKVNEVVCANLTSMKAIRLGTAAQVSRLQNMFIQRSNII